MVPTTQAGVRSLLGCWYAHIMAIVPGSTKYNSITSWFCISIILAYTLVEKVFKYLFYIIKLLNKNIYNIQKNKSTTRG